MRTKKCLSSGYSSFTLRSPPKHERYTASRNLRPRKPQFPSPSKTVLRHLPSARGFEDRFTSCSSTQGTQTESQSRNLQGAFTSTLPRLNSRIPRPKLQYGTRGVHGFLPSSPSYLTSQPIEGSKKQTASPVMSKGRSWRANLINHRLHANPSLIALE